jgi:CRP-like cAMP-binding protein
LAVISEGGDLSTSSRSQRLAALTAIPLFEGLSDEELASLGDLMTDRNVTAGTVLAEEGALGDEAMIIMSGTALVRRAGRVIDEMHGGDFFGEMSLVNHAPRNATVIASSDVRLLVIGSEEFFSMLEANPMVSVKILRTVAARFAATRDPGTI